MPAGTFVMGSPESEPSRSNDEDPAHTVRIPKALAIGRYEVTRDEFEAFVTSTGYDAGSQCRVRFGDEFRMMDGLNFRNPGYLQTGRHPVTCMDFAAAETYCRWLSVRTGKTYRLPSEAEWEYAARAGRAGIFPDASNYAEICAFGNAADRSIRETFPDQPVAECRDGFVYTAPAGSFRPNGFGLYDTIGNVREWVSDCLHKTYAGAPADGTPWLTEGDCRYRMLRGGSWFSEPWYVRSANRYWGLAAHASYYNGFRVVRELPP